MILSTAVSPIGHLYFQFLLPTYHRLSEQTSHTLQTSDIQQATSYLKQDRSFNRNRNCSFPTNRSFVLTLRASEYERCRRQRVSFGEVKTHTNAVITN